MINEKKYLTGGMDGDTATRLLAENAILNLMNGRMAVTQYGRTGRIENVPGTTLISNSVYPPYGTNQCIGGCVDVARSRLIWFNYNTSDDHGIYARDLSTGTTYAVLYDSQVINGLGFSKTSRIDRNCKVVGDLLYWTDDNNEPRRINIEAGIKMNHASYSTDVDAYQWPMNQSVISLVRRPPGLPVTGAKGTDGAVDENFLTLFSGSFAWRYIYRDGEESVFSIPSAMINYNYETDTYNFINIVFPTGETIDQDVEEVQLGVAYDNTYGYFIFKTWNKGVAAEAAEIAAHNTGTPLEYDFYNNETGYAVGVPDSVKPFDSVAIRAKTIEVALERLFLGNYTKGYDTPLQTSLATSLTSSSVSVDAARIFKSFSKYQVAIVFHDYSKRKCAVVTKPELVVDIPDRDFDGSPYITSIDWTLSNLLATTEIPDWAYYYEIVITKNLRTRFFVQSRALFMQYVIKNNDGTFSYQFNYSTSAYGIAVSLSLLNREGLGYSYSEGDNGRLYLNSTSTVYDLPVVGVDGVNVFLKATDLGDLSTLGSCVFEVYTPYFTSDSESFFSCGQMFKITNPATVSRQYSTTSGSVLGDCFRLRRQGASLLPLSHIAETMSPNDARWKNWFGIFGEQNIQLDPDLGQVEKNNYIQWSNTVISGTKTNGISSFEALNEKAMPLSMGELQKLQLASKVESEGRIMLAICQKETASLYLGEVQTYGSDQQAGSVNTVANVIGTINVLNGSSGTVNPESVIEHLGLVFWLDALNGYFTQYSSNGLEQVSRYKQSRFFKNYCKAYRAASTGNLDNINGFHHVPTCVDPFHKEVIASLPGLIYENYATTLPSYSAVPSYASSIINRFDIYDQLAKTMAFCYEENKWGSDFEFMAEFYLTTDDRLFGFKNGALYEFYTDTANWNTFFGVQKPLRLCVTGNLNPSLLKDINNTCVEGNAIPDFTVAMTTHPNTQITDLASYDYTDQQGNYYAEFLRDRLSPNATGTADEKLYTGDSLTDIVVSVMYEFQQYESLIFINFVNIGYSASRGQKQIATT
jgi:hypothetical protein